MALVMSASQVHAQTTADPAEMLGALLATLSEELASTEMFVSVFYGVLDPARGRLRYANAGHPHAFMVMSDGCVERLPASTPPLGMTEKLPSTAERPWVPNEDLLLLFTDGVSDARNRYDQRLGESSITDVVRAHRHEPPAALLERARIAPDVLDLDTIAFALAPRLNAAGRVGEALEAARLLLSTTREVAAVHADALEAANQTRRDLTSTAVAEARELVAADPDRPASIVRGTWPVGIIGLVAARLVEDRARPAVVGTELGETIRASCRSDGSVDLASALNECADLFTRHGGHAGAAGFELLAARWPEFVERFEAIAATHVPTDPRAVLAIDLAVKALDVDYRLFRELRGLRPYGPGNPEPLVAVLGLTVTRVRVAADDHTSMTLRRDRDVLDGIAFGRADIAALVHEGDRIDVVARISSRTFGGFESLQLEIRDAAPSGSHPEAAAILAGPGATLTVVAS